MPSYTIKSGQSLAKIAKAAGINLLDLVAANPDIQDPDLIFPGQKINLPTKPRSAGERNLAAQRIASGSYSAGTFSATGRPGGMMEVGELYYGPGGGLGAAAQGRTLGEYFGAPTVESVLGAGPYTPAEGPLAERWQEAAQYTPAEGELYERWMGKARGDAPRIESFEGDMIRLPNGRMIRSGEPSVSETPATVGPPRIAGRLGGGEYVPGSKPPEDLYAPVGGAISYGTNVRIEPRKPQIAGGTVSDRMPAFLQTSPGPKMDRWWEPREQIIGHVHNIQRAGTEVKIRKALIHAGGIENVEGILEEISTPLSMTDDQVDQFVQRIKNNIPSNLALAAAMATGNKGFGVTKDSSPEDQASRVNMSPIDMTPEEVSHRLSTPITMGEHRYNTGWMSPDAQKIVWDNHDDNVALTASYLLTGELRNIESAPHLEDSFFFLNAMANGEAWTLAVIDRAIERGFMSQLDKNNLINLRALVFGNEEYLVEDEETALENIKEELTKSGYEQVGTDLWEYMGSGNVAASTNPIWDMVQGGGTTDFVSQGPGDTRPKKRQKGDGDIPTPGPGFGNSGYGGGVTLYNWRISAPGVG